ncbi:MAG: MarR family transcriptional regulator [Bacteroidetes bacterium]|nr:MarR family transcriptional regulator [Bacteroidota bacterium]MCW5894951.1 MarR family transcriptional regulator [Bacteroidota bacterium]
MEEKVTRRANTNYAREIADLTFSLLANCQEKEQRLADQFRTTVPEFRCLRVFRGEAKMPVSALVERLNLSASRVTRILASLEHNGYLKRMIDPLDRRNIIVELTAKGLSFSRQLEDRYVKIHEELLAEIPVELHDSLVVGLRNLLTSVMSWLGTSSNEHS